MPPYIYELRDANGPEVLGEATEEHRMAARAAEVADRMSFGRFWVDGDLNPVPEGTAGARRVRVFMRDTNPPRQSWWSRHEFLTAVLLLVAITLALFVVGSILAALGILGGGDAGDCHQITPWANSCD